MTLILVIALASLMLVERGFHLELNWNIHGISIQHIRDMLLLPKRVMFRTRWNGTNNTGLFSLLSLYTTFWVFNFFKMQLYFFSNYLFLSRIRKKKKKSNKPIKNKLLRRVINGKSRRPILKGKQFDCNTNG